jgi:TonB-dependent siderophore receptor
LAHRQFCAFLLFAWLASLACAASDADARYGLRIPPGLSLEEALQELALQTGVQVVFFSQITVGHSAPEMSGDYTLAAAMARLLEGSDLTSRQINAHTIEVRRQPQRQRVRSSSKQPSSALSTGGPMEEVRIVGTVEQLVATRTPTPLREIPQSVSIISSEQIRQQNSVDIGDVMRNAPGIATRRVSSLDESAYSRAFPISSYHVDGGGALKPSLNQQTLYEGSPDLSEFDHIEVLRGSDALFTGNSNPGGTLSLVRKRPLHAPALNVSASLGSWDNYRLELDASGPLTDDGSLRARVDTVYATRDFFFDRAHLDRKKVFAALEYDFTPTATLTAGGSYQWDDALPLVGGVPLYSDASDTHLPRNTSLTFDWAFFNTHMGEAYLQYRQRFREAWNVKLNASTGRTIVEHAYGMFNVINTRTNTLPPPSAYASSRPNRYALSTIDATLTGKLDWLGLREVIAVGADFTRVTARQVAGLYIAFGPPLASALSFDPASYPDPRSKGEPAIGLDTRLRLEQYGAFISVQVDVHEAWSVSGGARLASDTLVTSGNLSLSGVKLPDFTSELSSSDVVTPFAGLLYRMNDHLSWYASYADIYLTWGSGPPLRAGGSVLGPVHGINLETGIKGAWRDGAVNASLAVYRIRQQHVPLKDDSVTSNLPNCCYVSGTARSRGAELQVDGELTPTWLIAGGYMYNENESADGGIPTTATPRHLFKIWTSKRLPATFSRWTVGGSLRGQTPSHGTPFLDCTQAVLPCVKTEGHSQKAYAVMDLRAAFQVHPDWEVALSMNNVFDKRYYLSQNSPEYKAWYGEPRNFMLRVDASY